MMDYPCDKFGDCSFSRFGSHHNVIIIAYLLWRCSTGAQQCLRFYCANRQTDTDERFTPATVVGVSNKHARWCN